MQNQSFNYKRIAKKIAQNSEMWNNDILMICFFVIKSKIKKI